MMGSHEFLTNLAVVMCVAAVTTVVFQRLRQPVVFGYLLAGLIVGPHTAVPLIANEAMTQTLAELGVILLMFSLGLEFTIRKLIKVGPTAGVIGLFETTGMAWLGYMTARLLGWTSIESIYAGAIVAISSTTIIIKAFGEQGRRERFTRLVFGILIVEDLIAIFMLALLTTISGGEGINASAVAATAFDLALFLSAIITVGLLLVPRLVRLVVGLERSETILVTVIGICFAFALLAVAFGYSVALGAFTAGFLVAESGHAKIVERLVRPVADMFGAIFFVAVGMLINPRLIVENIGAVVALVAVVVIGKVLFVGFGAFATGQGTRTSVQSGMSMAQIGEFSFIIATLGVSVGAIRGFLYPVAVAVSAITTLSTPVLINRSARAASWLDRKLPRTLQTYVALYGSWIEKMRAPRQRAAITNRKFLLLAADTVLVTGLVIVTALKLEPIASSLATALSLQRQASHWLVAAAAAAIAAPLVAGILRITQVLSQEQAARAFPVKPSSEVDFAAAPRRTLQVTLHLLMVLLIGGLIVAVTQPFLPLFRGTILLAAIVVVLGVALWRSATNLRGHTRAGAEIIAMALSRQMAAEHTVAPAAVQRVRAALPGLGEPVPVSIPPGGAAAGHTLRDLDVRGSTGATVLTILREGGEEVLLPDGHESVNEGDVLFIAGTSAAVKAARALLAR